MRFFGGVSRPTRLGVLNSSPYSYQKAVSLVPAGQASRLGVLIEAALTSWIVDGAVRDMKLDSQSGPQLATYVRRTRHRLKASRLGEPVENIEQS